jgi:hypothetical protein
MSLEDLLRKVYDAPKGHVSGELRAEIGAALGIVEKVPHSICFLLGNHTTIMPESLEEAESICKRLPDDIVRNIEMTSVRVYRDSPAVSIHRKLHETNEDYLARSLDLIRGVLKAPVRRPIKEEAE